MEKLLVKASLLTGAKGQIRALRTRLQPKAPEQRQYPIVTVKSWRSGRGYANFGDDLSRVIVTLLIAKSGRTLDDEARTPRQLLAIGSIMHLAQTDAVIWGTGVNGKVPDDFHKFESLDIRAVRGPHTRDWLRSRHGLEVPEIYGDPALLLPELVGSRLQANPVHDHVFVPNLNDLLGKVELNLPSGVKMISPMQSWNRVVADIVQARFVSSTSLHGLVVAEAFGIPARYVRLSQEESLLKYDDYYAGTGREKYTMSSSVAEAAEMGGERPISFDSQKLRAAFPWDLWC